MKQDIRGMKECVRCGKSRDVTEFHKTRSGYNDNCKPCIVTLRRENKRYYIDKVKKDNSKLERI